MKANKTISLLGTILILLSLSFTAHCATVIAFGDSITAGHSSSTGGYPPKLNAILNDNGKPSSVINQGVSGEQTPTGVGRIGGVLASWPANLILIMEGVNDLRSGISVETTRHNLESMIAQSNAAGVTPILATLTPTTSSLVPDVWNPMIINLAKSTGTALADQYTAILPTWPTSNADGLHPNDTGYWTIANTWYGVIGPMISSSGEVDPGGGGDGGSSGPCFIATAAFNSPIEKHVVLLKNFRDNFLMTNSPGKLFVENYYQYSPPVADFIRQHESAKLVVRVLLYPLIGLSYFLLKLNLTVQLGIAALLAAGLAFSAMTLQRRRLSQV